MNTYQLLARFYEHIIDDVLTQLIIDKVFEHTKPCKTLEIGCGSAYISRTLAQKGYQVAAMDQSTAMLEVAANYAAYDQLDIGFYVHDMHTPFDYPADLIIMPTDVINHADSPSAMATIIDHVYSQLNKEGIFILDILNCNYLQQLIGHQETISLPAASIHWKVTADAQSCAVNHHITMDGVHATHRQMSVSQPEIDRLLSRFECIDFLCLKERTIYVLKK